MWSSWQFWAFVVFPLVLAAGLLVIALPMCRFRWHIERAERIARRRREAELQALYKHYESAMDQYDAENKAANPDWDGQYTTSQKAYLDALRARGCRLIRDRAAEAVSTERSRP